MSAALLIRIALVISVVIFVIALGLRSAPADESFLLKRPGLLARSLLAMNLIMPLIAVWLVYSFDLRIPVKIALVALSVSPLPPVLPAKRLNLSSHGYIYSLVVAASLCSVILVPLSAWLLSAHFHTRGVASLKVFLVVVVTVLAPLFIGIFIRRSWPTHASRLATVLAQVGMVLLVLSSVPVLVMEWQTMHALLGDGTLIAALALSGIGLLVGHVLGGGDPQNRTVLALATASRHPGVAVLAGISASAEAPRLVTAAVVLAFVVSLIVTAPYAAWRRRVHAMAARVTA